MIHWLYPANVKYYDVFGAFAQKETYWPVNSKVAVDDIIYFYLSAPYKQIGFVCRVLEVDMDERLIIDKIRPFFKGKVDGKKQPKLFMRLQVSSAIALERDSLLAYDSLKQNGLNGMLMGPRKLENNPSLEEYIRRCLPWGTMK